MDRIDRILRCEAFRENLAACEAAEKDRIFCRHGMAHLLDVARIATIISLEEGLGIDRELIYGAALLHDIGRFLQYTDGVPHEQASAAIAVDILKASGYTDKETDVIVAAIKTHREVTAATKCSLGDILYRADKASRLCFACDAEADCNWEENRKNRRILY